jgi:hypothetical protein
LIDNTTCFGYIKPCDDTHKKEPAPLLPKLSLTALTGRSGEKDRLGRKRNDNEQQAVLGDGALPYPNKDGSGFWRI